MKQPLPIKRKQINSGAEEWDLGFFEIKHFTPPHKEPILPTIENGNTVYKTGYGYGIY
jgi:hypothetical protein